MPLLMIIDDIAIIIFAAAIIIDYAILRHYDAIIDIATYIIILRHCHY